MRPVIKLIVALFVAGLSSAPVLAQPGFEREQYRRLSQNVIEVLEIAGLTDGIKEAERMGATRLMLGGLSITDDRLAELSQLDRLEVLDLSRTLITDQGLKALEPLANLRTLYLPNNDITDAGLEHLQGLTNLTELNLFGTDVTGVGFKKLADLKKLETLNLGATLLTAEGLAAVSTLPNLKSLNLSGLEMTAEQLKILRDMPKVSVTMDSQGMKKLFDLLATEDSLHLWDRAKDVNMQRPNSPQEIYSLNLSNLEITDDSLKGLQGLKRLGVLNLQGTAVTDDGMKELRQLKQLRSLIVIDTQVTTQGLQELKALRRLSSIQIGARGQGAPRTTQLPEMPWCRISAPSARGVRLP